LEHHENSLSSGTGISVDTAQPSDGVTLHERFLRPPHRIEISRLAGAPASDPAGASERSALFASPAATSLLGQSRGASAADRGHQRVRLPAMDEISALICSGRATSVAPMSDGKLFSKCPPPASPRFTPAPSRSAAIHSERWFVLVDSLNEPSSRNRYGSSSAPDVPSLRSGSLDHK
jgi:hypothetical protein